MSSEPIDNSSGRVSVRTADGEPGSLDRSSARTADWGSGTGVGWGAYWEPRTGVTRAINAEPGATVL